MFHIHPADVLILVIPLRLSQWHWHCVRLSSSKAHFRRTITKQRLQFNHCHAWLIPALHPENNESLLIILKAHLNRNCDQKENRKQKAAREQFRVTERHIGFYQWDKNIYSCILNRKIGAWSQDSGNHGGASVWGEERKFWHSDRQNESITMTQTDRWGVKEDHWTRVMMTNWKWGELDREWKWAQQK